MVVAISRSWKLKPSCVDAVVDRVGVHQRVRADAQQRGADRDGDGAGRAAEHRHERDALAALLGDDLLEHGRLVDRPPQVERDREQREREQERDAPSPRGELLGRQDEGHHDEHARPTGSSRRVSRAAGSRRRSARFRVRSARSRAGSSRPTRRRATGPARCAAGPAGRRRAIRPARRSGSRPIAPVATPMMPTVHSSVVRRPSRSPMWPKMIAPIGRTTNASAIVEEGGERAAERRPADRRTAGRRRTPRSRRRRRSRRTRARFRPSTPRRRDGRGRTGGGEGCVEMSQATILPPFELHGSRPEMT